MVVLILDGCVLRIPLRAAEANEEVVGAGVGTGVGGDFHLEASDPAGLFVAAVLGAAGSVVLRFSSSLIRR